MGSTAICPAAGNWPFAPALRDPERGEEREGGETRGGAAARRGERATPFAAQLAIGGGTVLEEEGRGDTPLWIGPGAAWRPTARVRLTLAAGLPLTSPRRYDARLRLGSVLSF